MRLIVAFLLTANAVFLAYATGHLDSLRGADAMRLARQVDAAAVKVLAVDEDRPLGRRDAGGSVAPQAVSAPTAAVPQAPASPPIAPQAAAAQAAVPPASAPQTPAAQTPSTAGVPSASAARVCLAWRVAAADAERLVGLFSERFPEFGLARHKGTAGDGNWWVFIPLQGDKAEVERVRGELNQKGFHDHFAIADGKDRYTISLGVYSVEKTAQGFLARLKDKGIDGARLVQRAGKEGLQQVVATGAAALQGQVVAAVAQLLPGAKARDCQ